MNIIILICSIYGLTFAIRQTDGPWNIVSHWRNWMMRLPIIGVQFYKLLECAYCTGWWSGLIIYFLTQETYKWQFFVLWSLAGGTISLIIDALLSKLHQ